MALTLRSASTSTGTTKGAALTHAEMDANWLHALKSSNQSFAPYENLSSTNIQDALREEVDDLAASTGSSLVGFVQSGSGTIATTVHTKNRENRSLFDFMTEAEKGNVRDGTGTTDVSAAVERAVEAWLEDDECQEMRAPPGRYYIAAPISYAFAASNLLVQKRLHGYGAEFVFDFDDDTAYGLELSVVGASAEAQARKFTIDGLTFRALGASDETGGLLRLNGGTASDRYLFMFGLRELSFEDFLGTGLQLIGNAFEAQLYGLTATANASNTAGYGVHLLNSGSGQVSSVDIYGLTTRRAKNGLFVASGNIGAKLYGGTFINAAEHGASIFGKETSVIGSHFENCWQGGDASPSWGTTAAGLQVAGGSTVIGVYGTDSTSKMRYVVRGTSCDHLTILGGGIGGTVEYFARLDGVAGNKYTCIGLPLGTTGRVHTGLNTATNNYTEMGGHDGSPDPATPVIGLTYGETVATDASVGNYFTLTVTDANNLTISNPTNPTNGQELTYTIFNNSGSAMGTITWGNAFKLAGSFTNPATGNRRVITFKYHSAAWRELNRSAADQLN